MTTDKQLTSMNGSGARIGAQLAHIYPPAGGPFYEVLTSDELAKRLRVPSTWIRQQVRSRAIDPIPHFKLGRYVRFSWGSPELTEWLRRRQSGRRQIRR